MEDQDHKRVRRWRREEVDKLVEDYRASGLTRKRWCHEREIGITTLGYWLQRERKASNDYSLVSIEIEDKARQRGLLDLRINGMDLRVGAGSDLQALALLLKELR